MNTSPRDAVIVSAVRTPTGNFLGSLSSFTAPQLGALVIKEAVKRTGIDPQEVDEVIMGQVLQGGCGQAPARQAAIHAGIPPEKGALTINKVCGSGLKAVELAAQAIRLGDLDVIVAGGMESMSNAPYVLHGARNGFKFGDQRLRDGMVLDGLWDSFNDFHMGMAAELTAEKSQLAREELDQYAYNSQMKAVKAIQGGKFKNEIVSLEIPQRKGEPIDHSVGVVVHYKVGDLVQKGTPLFTIHANDEEKLAAARERLQRAGCSNAQFLLLNAETIEGYNTKMAEQLLVCDLMDKMIAVYLRQGLCNLQFDTLRDDDLLHLST